MIVVDVDQGTIRSHLEDNAVLRLPPSEEYTLHSAIQEQLLRFKVVKSTSATASTVVASRPVKLLLSPTDDSDSDRTDSASPLAAQRANSSARSARGHSVTMATPPNPITPDRTPQRTTARPTAGKAAFMLTPKSPQFLNFPFTPTLSHPVGPRETSGALWHADHSSTMDSMATDTDCAFTFAIRQAFLNVFCSMLCGYRKFVFFLGEGSAAVPVFNAEAYLKSRQGEATAASKLKLLSDVLSSQLFAW